MGFAGIDVFVAASALVPVVGRAQQLGVFAACISLDCLSRVGWWLCLTGIALNYFMHAGIWYFPQDFARLCDGPLKALGSHPVDVFAALEVVAKLVQLAALVVFLGSSGLAAALSAATSAPGWCWGTLAVSVGAGQALNFATYKAIGNAGVYYGFKLGRTVPWCYGFPFTSGLRHPQYVGVVLTLWGALTVLVCEELAALGLPQMVMAWGLMYVGTSAMEQAGDNDSGAEDKAK